MRVSGRDCWLVELHSAETGNSEWLMVGGAWERIEAQRQRDSPDWFTGNGMMAYEIAPLYIYIINMFIYIYDRVVFDPLHKSTNQGFDHCTW